MYDNTCMTYSCDFNLPINLNPHLGVRTGDHGLGEHMIYY